MSLYCAFIVDTIKLKRHGGFCPKPKGKPFRHQHMKLLANWMKN